ncbi:MAG: HAMP domain-containing sensor histidine kinase [Planctomycetota bacterium]
MTPHSKSRRSAGFRQATGSAQTGVSPATLENNRATSGSSELREDDAAIEASYRDGLASQLRADESHLEPAVAAATRLVSETAHDLRSPLSSVMAAVQMIVSGEMGPVSELQQSILLKTLQQCEYVDALVQELTQADRLTHRAPLLYRRPVRRSELRDAVAANTDALLKPRSIQLMWDGFDEPSRWLWIDCDIVCRLLTNLIVNAQRVTQENGSILLRLQDDIDAGKCVISVIDSGEGIPASVLDAIESGNRAHAERSEAIRAAGKTAGSEGLGLMICRQLAAACWSDLQLRSIPSVGSEISITVPHAKPAAIANAYAEHRERARLRKRPKAARTDPSMRPQAKASAHEGAQVVTLSGTGTPRRPNHVALAGVTMGAACPTPLADEADRILQRQLTEFELGYRTGKRSWVCVLDADQHSMHDRIETLDQHCTNEIEGLRLMWSNASVIATRTRPLIARLTDWMASQELNHNLRHTVDQNTVRLGTDPLEASQVASTRLDVELTRLGKRMRQQAATLQAQARRLGPSA